MTFPPSPEEMAQRKEEAIAAFNAAHPAFVDAYLAKVGIAKHERTAQWDLVPAPIRAALPKNWDGFGLIGGFGIGKTFTIAAGIRNMAVNSTHRKMAAVIEKGEVYDLKQCAKQGDLHIQPWPLWCSWPQESAARRAQLFRHEGPEVEDWILNLLDPARLVILDDLGASRATAQDWEGETLARIVDERLRQEAPTIWTSNLDTKGLTERYGLRTYSRLHALAPGIRLPRMPDLRIQKENHHE